MDSELTEKPAPMVRVIAAPYLSVEHGRIDRLLPEGATVAGHLRALGWSLESLNARVFIDGRLIEQAQWESVIPRAGQCFAARVVPMGGEGGKTALRIVGMLAIVVAAAYTGGAAGALIGPELGIGEAAGTALYVGVVSIAGSMAMNALVPPALPRRPLPLPAGPRQIKEAA